MSAGSDPRPGLIVARTLAGLAMTVATLLVLRPFLVPITWAAIVAYVTWPLYGPARQRVGSPHVVAALFTAAIALVAAVPVAGLLVALAGEAAHLVDEYLRWKAAGATLPDWIAERAWLVSLVEGSRSLLVPESLAVGDWIARYGSRLSSQLGQFTGSIARNLMEFGVTLVTLFVFYLEGERVVVGARRLAFVLFPSAPSQFLEQIGASIRGVVFGLLGTAIVQGVLAGAAFTVAGVPSPVALGVMTAAFSLVPAGPTLLGLVVAAGLLLEGRIATGVGVGLWMLLVVASVDNVLRPLLISGPTRIPFLLVFLGVLGGLGWLGLLGIFVGPVLLSVAFTLLTGIGEPRTSGSGEPAPVEDAETEISGPSGSR